MRAKAMDSLGHMHPAEGLAPGNGVSLVARLNRQGVRRLCPASNKPVYLLLDVDERLLHGEPSVGPRMAGCKQRNSPFTRTLLTSQAPAIQLAPMGAGIRNSDDNTAEKFNRSKQRKKSLLPPFPPVQIPGRQTRTARGQSRLRRGRQRSQPIQPRNHRQLRGARMKQGPPDRASPEGRAKARNSKQPSINVGSLWDSSIS